MDSELLKDKSTDVALSKCVPAMSELLVKMRCLSQKYPLDCAINDYKRKLGASLKPTVDNTSTISMNVGKTGIQFLSMALYHACTSPAFPERNLILMYKETVDAWMRLYLRLGVDDEELEFKKILNDFAYIYSYVTYSSSSLQHLTSFLCPMCILDDAFSNIGWTEFVCPQTEETASFNQPPVSKRGDIGKPNEWCCRHTISDHQTNFNNILYELYSV